MNRRSIRLRGSLLALVTALVAAGCGNHTGTAPLTIRRLEPPVSPDSRVPSLETSEGALYLSWVEKPDSGPAALRYSVLRDASWSEPQTIVEDEQLLVNWADFPSLRVRADGTLSAHWLLRQSGHSFAYDIGLGWQRDGEWLVARAHDDRARAEHGFVSLVRESDSRLGVVWLDGRSLEGDHGAMRLMYRSWDGNEPGPETILDDDVCTCCQTAALRVGSAIVVAYRDHSRGEIRDISIVRREGDTWSSPVAVTADGWQIAACPVNGPALSSRGQQVHLIWFTAAQSDPRVLLARSDDGALTFGDPVRIDDGAPLGRVDIASLADGSVAAVWLEQDGRQAEVRLRTLAPDGAPGQSMTLGRTSAAPSSGFPRIVAYDDGVAVAWTAIRGRSHVEAVTVSRR